MTSDYKKQLKNILDHSGADLERRFTVTYKPCFGAVAGYLDGQIFCCCGSFGFALKLAAQDISHVIGAGGKALQYFPNGHIKKDYAVLSKSMLVDHHKLHYLITASIGFLRP